jgi:dihydroorotate dehydrogenase
MRVDTLELNLGCPNVHSEGKQKPIFAYDLDLAGGALTRVADEWKGPLAIKLSPYNGKTMEMFAKRIAALINRQPRHFQPGDSVVVCNTLPNFAPQNEQGAPLLRAIGADGQIITAGGMGGRRLLPHALKDVLRFRKWLPSDIAIDAVGGIETGKDVLTYHTVGATGFQIGTAYFKNDDPRIFSRVLEELA